MIRMRQASGPRALLIGVVVASLLQAQQNPPLQLPPPPETPPQQPQQARPPANQAPTNVPARPAGQAPAAQTPAGQPPAAQPPATAAQTAPPVSPALSDSGGFLLDNVSLIELIDILARR